MRLNWKGRSYRPAGNYIRVYKPSINELMKPLSEKGRLGSAILTGEILSGIGDAYAPEPTSPVITPSVTPTNTETPSPTPSLTPSETPTNTPSVTPSSTPASIPQDCVWDTNTLEWSANTNNWEVCQDVPQPSPTPSITPSPTETNTPTPSVTQTNTPSVTPSLTPTNTNTPTPSSTPATFNPSSLGNLQYWFMSNTGFTTSTWTNYGLLAGSITQGTATFQPSAVSTTMGSFTGTAIQFASRDVMSGTFTSTNFSAQTCFLVMKRVAASTANKLAYTLTSNYSVQAEVGSSGPFPGRINAAGVGRNFTYPASGNVLVTTSGTTTAADNYVNDTLISTSNSTYSPVNAVTQFQVGNDPGSSNSSDFRIFEILTYNKVLNSSEYNQVVNYLKSKYQYSSW